MASIPAWSRATAVWLGAIGRPALSRALPVWLGAGLIGAIVLGGTGVQPRDLAAVGAASPAVLIGAAAAWLVLLAPAVRGAIGAPGVGLLRSLPGARPLEAIAVGALALAVHAPWGVLAWLAAGGRGALSWVGMAAASLAIALAAARLGRRARAPRWRSGLGALVGVHARAVARRRGGSVSFGVGLALLAGALGGALARSGALDAAGAATLVAACAAVAAAIALAAIATVVVDDRRALAAWRGAAGVPAGTDRAALALVLGGGGALLGAIGGGAAVAIAGFGLAAAAAAIGAAAAVGLGVGGALAALAERSADAAAPGPRIAVAAALIAIGALAALGGLGGLGAAAVAIVGVGLAAGSGGGR